MTAREASDNAEGYNRSAASQVDERWHDHVDDALAILKTLREPDSVMAAAGNAAIWQKMVEAAIDAEQRVFNPLT